MEISKTKLGDLGTMSGVAPQSSTAAELPAGKVLSDRYELVRVIGRGGMGVVYEAVDRLRGASVALKFLAAELVASDTATQRLLNEARIASDLAHENIVRVYDVSKYDNSYFLSMELLQGQSLRQLLQQLAGSGQKMPVAQALRIARDVAQALAYAHRTTIHRDIKPENIWILPDGKAKLMDFGIARLQSQTQGLTKTATALGTAYYMAPEQLVGSGQIDHRADQYSLGVVLYEMLTGTLPIGRIDAVSRSRPGLSSKLDALVAKALSGRPEERYADDAAMLKVLTSIPEKEDRARPKPSLGIAAVGIVVLAAMAYGAYTWNEQNQMAQQAVQLALSQQEAQAKQQAVQAEAQRLVAEADATRRASEAQAQKKAAEAIALKAAEAASAQKVDPVERAMQRERAKDWNKPEKHDWGRIAVNHMQCTRDGQNATIRGSVTVSIPAGSWFGFGFARHTTGGGWISDPGGSIPDLNCGPFVSGNYGTTCTNQSATDTQGTIEVTVRLDKDARTHKPDDPWTFVSGRPFITRKNSESQSKFEVVKSGFKILCRLD